MSSRSWSGEVKIRLLGQDDLIKLGLSNLQEMLDLNEKALVDYYEKKVIYPGFHYVWVRKDSKNRIKSMPLAAPEQKIAHHLWVSYFPENPERFGCQNVTGLEVLNDPENGMPLAVMDGTAITNLRVGLMAGCGAKYLARQDSETLGFIGTGMQARNILLAILLVRPKIQQVRLSAKTRPEVDAFIDDMRHHLPNLDFYAAEDLKDAIGPADIKVTATSAQEPLLKKDWIRPGDLYIHVAGWEDDYDVVKKAQKVVVDDWVKIRECHTQTITRMHDEKLFNQNEIYAEIPEIILGRKKGRENSEEFIYYDFTNQCPELYMANVLYRRSIEKGVGSDFALQQKPLFDRRDFRFQF